MAEDNGNGTGSNFIWAITIIIFFAIIVVAVYYSGFLGFVTKKH